MAQIREGEDQDIVKVVHHEPKSTESQAFFNFMKSIFGVGVIAIPYTSQKTGYLWTAPLLMMVAYACYKSTLFLLEVADEVRAHNSLLADVARISLNSKWGAFADVLVVLNQVAHCIAYIIFFTTFLQLSLINVGIQVHVLNIFIVALVALIPLTLVSNIHFFHSTSFIGMVLSVLGVFITVLYGWMNIAFYEAPIHFEEPIKLLNTFSFIGVGINCFDGIPTALPIRNTLADRPLFQSVFTKVMISEFVIVLITQQLSVLAYGPNITPIMMFSIDNPWWQFAAAVCYCISILLTYPVKIYPAIEIIESFFTSKPYSDFADSELRERHNQHYPIWTTDPLQLVIRMILTLLVFFSAYVIPNFSAFLNLVGSIVGTLLVSFPCLMHLALFGNKLKGRDIFDYFLIFTFCFITMIFGVWDSLEEMSQGQAADL